MKPTLVDNCEHYNFQTHNCNKCGRGLPDVCLDYEVLKKKAEAYDLQIQSQPVRSDTQVIPNETEASPRQTERAFTEEQTPLPKATRGRPKKASV